MSVAKNIAPLFVLLTFMILKSFICSTAIDSVYDEKGHLFDVF